MARCYINMTYRVPEPQPEPKPIQDVVLHMTVEEAGTLKQLLNQIGGDPEGPRGVLDKISAALHEAGVVSTRYKVEIHFSALHDVSYLRIEKGDS